MLMERKTNSEGGERGERGAGGTGNWGRGTSGSPSSLSSLTSEEIILCEFLKKGVWAQLLEWVVSVKENMFFHRVFCFVFVVIFFTFLKLKKAKNLQIF